MDQLTTSSAAMRYGVSSRTVARWLSNGTLTGSRTRGGHWRIDAEQLPLPRRLEPLQPDPGEVLRVAIIEDDPLQADALARLVSLLAPAARVELASDGLSAGLLLGILVPHIAFVDIEMPELDGIEVIRRARAVPALSSTAFMVLSGQLTEARRRALERLGVAHMAHKPVSTERIRTFLTDHGPAPVGDARRWTRTVASAPRHTARVTE